MSKCTALLFLHFEYTITFFFLLGFDVVFNLKVLLRFVTSSILSAYEMSSSFFISAIQREQDKVKRSIKDAAKKGQKDVCVVLAKEVIQSKRAVNKLYATKAHMNSVMLGMKNQCGEFRSVAF